MILAPRYEGVQGSEVYEFLAGELSGGDQFHHPGWMGPRNNMGNVNKTDISRRYWRSNPDSSVVHSIAKSPLLLLLSTAFRKMSLLSGKLIIRNNGSSRMQNSLKGTLNASTQGRAETERQEVSKTASRWLRDTRLARCSGAVAFWDWMLTSQRQCTEPSLFRPTCVITLEAPL